MTLSKRLALLGVRSAISVSKPQGFGSSYGLIDRRPFPYRQISEFTKDSNPSKNSDQLRYNMETLQDSSPELMNSEDDRNTDFRRTTDELRAEVEKIRTKLAMAGFIYRHPFSDLPKKKIKYRSELAKMVAERREVESLRSGILMYESSVDADIRLGKGITDFNNRWSKNIREFRADVQATNRQIAIWGTAIAILTPAFFVALALSM